jgi:hypothetical protein
MYLARSRNIKNPVKKYRYDLESTRLQKSKKFCSIAAVASQPELA